MLERTKELLDAAGLSRIGSILEEYSLPAIGFSLAEPAGSQGRGTSKVGGSPDLPKEFDWPLNKERPIDYLLQINLKDLQPHPQQAALPAGGLLTFFYDILDEPWGYDPKDQDGFRVLYTADLGGLQPKPIPNDENALPERSMTFYSKVTLPNSGSRAYDKMTADAHLSDDEEDRYLEFLSDYEALYSANQSSAHHQMLGHSANIQGDMQLEAQLVTNGIYCGDPTGYEDPRANVLEKGADDWMLLLQFDSDESVDVMWGDCGMLYYWVQSDDLKDSCFENVWMTSQCY